MSVQASNKEGFQDRPGVFIGTSGWSYAHWKGNFYPATLPQGEMLESYAKRFITTELNASFYRLPPEHALLHWRETVPDGFVFSVKASRFITHMKKLKDPESTLPPFMKRVRMLQPKLGPILFQLPSRWHQDLQRLTAFLNLLDRNHRCVFEFRDPSWFDERVYSALAEHKAAFCIYDLDRMLSPLQVTADFVYVRLHGPDGPYQGSYDKHALSIWAERMRKWRAEGKRVYCYFDNDQNGYAARNALELKGMLD
jgi:uncharacterized protein YecE (DUF72 family)